MDGIIENVMEESNNKKEETVGIADAPQNGKKRLIYNLIKNKIKNKP